MIDGSYLSRVWRLIATHRWRLVTLFVVVLLPLYLFGEIAEEVIEQKPFLLDERLLLYAYGIATPLLDSFMLFISWLGYGYGVVPVSVALFVWLLARGRTRDAVFFGLAVGGAGALNQLAKWLFARERPKLWPSIAPESTFSFPSGHAMGSMALVAALVILVWPTKWRALAIVVGGLFTLLVGVSRVYLGVHYPSDVLAGWLAGFAWVMGLSYVLYGRIGRPEAAPQQPTTADLA